MVSVRFYILKDVTPNVRSAVVAVSVAGAAVAGIDG